MTPVLDGGPGATPDWLPALLAAARSLGRRGGSVDLIRGLPLAGGRLDDSRLAEAAARADLLVETLETRVAELSATELPALALLADGAAVALLRRDRQGFVAGAGRRTFRIAEEELAPNSPVRVVRPAYFFDHRSALYDFPHRGHWFAGPLFANSGLYGHAVLASVFVNLAAIAISLFTMTVYDRVLPSNALYSLVALVSGILIVVVVDLLLKTIRGYLVDAAGRRFDTEVGARLFAHMLSMLPEKRPQSAGTLANTARDFEAVRDFFTSATLIALGDLPFVALYLAVIWLVAGSLVVVPLLAVPVVVAAGIILQWPLARVAARATRESAQRAVYLHEIAVGVDTVKAANAQAWARRQWEALLAQNADTSLKSRQLSHFSGNFVAFVAAAVTVGTVTYGALLIGDGALTGGALIAAVILSGRALQPFARLANLMATWQRTRFALQSLNAVMRIESEDEGATLQRFAIRGALEVAEVTFAYPPQASGQAAPPGHALRDLSLAIRTGTCVAVIGRVGSGKTTLLRLLIALHRPQAGHVKVDGIDVRQIHPAELRAQIGYVGQDPVLFHGTVRENIVIGREDASDGEVLAAAQTVGLDSLLRDSPLGLGAPVGERGERLSGGQRQAVALARALVGDPPVLLLDEPTSMMDHSTERRFLSELAEARVGRTTVIVTHKPAVMALAERVVVLDAGRVVLDGPREEVINRLVGTVSQGVA